jgi:hypothetical protein
MPKVYLAEGSTFTTSHRVGVVLTSDKSDDAKIDWSTTIDLENGQIDSNTNNGLLVGEFEGKYQIHYNVYLEVGSNRLYYYE